jgi:hypothetical protein
VERYFRLIKKKKRAADLEAAARNARWHSGE